MTITIEPIGKGYRLWFQGTQLRDYSRHGFNRALEDAEFLKRALASLGYEARIDAEEHQ